MEKTELLALCVIVAVISFLGFAVEDIWLSITKGYMDNRNMYFPFLFGYGLAVIVLWRLFGTPQNLMFCTIPLAIRSPLARKVLYVLFIMTCICAGEVLLGTLVEKLCHFQWWDFSRLPLHITQYTSIPTSAAFSLMIGLFMDNAFEPILRNILAWDYEVLRFTASLLMAIMIGDFVHSGYYMYRNKQMLMKWKIDTTHTRGYRLLHPDTTDK